VVQRILGTSVAYSGGRHLYLVKRRSRRSAQRGYMVVPRIRTWSALSSVMPFPSLPSLNIRQSWTTKNCVENPSLQPSLQHHLRTFLF